MVEELVCVILDDKPNERVIKLFELLKYRMNTSKKLKISNQFIKKFNLENYDQVKSIGTPKTYGNGNKPLNGVFSIPIDIAISYRHELIYVSDYKNYTIQTFDLVTKQFIMSISTIPTCFLYILIDDLSNSLFGLGFDHSLYVGKFHKPSEGRGGMKFEKLEKVRISTLGESEYISRICLDKEMSHLYFVENSQQVRIVILRTMDLSIVNILEVFLDETVKGQESMCLDGSGNVYLSTASECKIIPMPIITKSSHVYFNQLATVFPSVCEKQHSDDL